jgi:hypothetical protein
MKLVFKTLSYTGMFTLGLYASSQFKFNTPIEPHRWAITSLVFVLCLIASNKKDSKNETN